MEDYKVDINLHGGYNSDKQYWKYHEGGQHTSQVWWHIAYALNDSRRREVIQNSYVLLGMSLHIKYRTSSSVGQDWPNGYFWNFKPIIGLNT